jgi:hypothetical protein
LPQIRHDTLDSPGKREDSIAFETDVDARRSFWSEMLAQAIVGTRIKLKNMQKGAPLKRKV